MRTITPEETEQLAAQFKAISLKLTQKAWLLGVFAAAAILVSVQFALESYSVPATSNAVLVFFSLVAIWLIFAGVAGATNVVVFGTRQVQRYLFGATLGGAILAFSFKGSWTEIVGSISAILVIIGGNVTFLSELQNSYRTTRLLPSIKDDLLDGIVWHFERAFPTENPDSPQLRQTVAVFPRSKLVVAANGIVPINATIVGVTETTAGGTGTADAPLANYRPSSFSDEVKYRQRHLTTEETGELALLARRELRKMVPHVLLMFWCSTALACAAEAFASHRSTQLSARSLSIAVVFTAACFAKYLQTWRKVRADLRGGIVVVLRSNRSDSDEVYFETLPNSNRLWSEFGAPSRWRHRPTGARPN
jgi:hypothetical protein